MKMYGMIVMLRYHQTNSGALNTMVALKWNGNGEIDILVTILVCWRLGPYADPDQQGDIKTMPLDGKTAHRGGNVCVMCVLLEFFVHTGTHLVLSCQNDDSVIKKKMMSAFGSQKRLAQNRPNCNC